MSEIVTLDKFLSRFPQDFELVNPNLIQSYLNLCESQFCQDSDRWGDAQEEAILHLTAHFVTKIFYQELDIVSNAVSVTSGGGGKPMPVSDDDLSTTAYGQIYKTLRDSTYLVFGMS